MMWMCFASSTPSAASVCMSASVVITQYAGQAAADAFKKRLTALGMPVYMHYPIAGYPGNVPLIVSDEGYGTQRVHRDHPPARCHHRARPRLAARWRPASASSTMSTSAA